MKQILLAAAVLVLAAGCSVKSTDPDVNAASALASRVMGPQARQIEFRRIDAAPEDVFRVASEGGKVVISGNNANSMAVGLNYYLQYCCNATVGWFADEKPVLPKRLPAVAEPVESKARVAERFFLNYCTYGYTMPWWNWTEWEHFIDWMALNGVNLPLAITGQESIWYEVWTSLGLPAEEVRAYFTGPSHLPWHRMLNIDRWGGPLTQGWLDGQKELQKQIVARERELNMKPVLPAFSGHVPEALKTVWPEAKINKMGSWCGFPPEDVPCFLDPMDSLFPVIQKMFLDKEREIYGTDHIYGIDLFNEMEPPSDEPEYLGRVSRQVYESLAAADPEGVWLQMTWLFWNERNFWTNERVEPYITSYPKEKSLLLDYYCERQEVWQRTEQYFGVPYIWCYLGNFGGNTYLAGDLKEINRRIENTFVNGGENFRGIGSTLEGFDCNPFMYRYIFEKAWDYPQHRDPDAYARVLADSRTGKADDGSRAAWKTLLDSIYVSRSVPGHSPLLNLRPSLRRSSSYHSNVRYSYNNAVLKEAVAQLLASGGSGPAYEFDVVNLTRQWISNHFEEEFARYKAACEAGDRAEMTRLQGVLLETFDVLEKLLSTQSYFLVGKWIADARAWGQTPEEADYFESNARNLLTTWGDRGNLLTDYANRTWAGVVSTYYKGRWEMFFAAVNAAFDAGGTFDDEAEKALLEQIKDFEKAWWAERPGTFALTPSGNPVEAAAEALTWFD